MHDIRKFVKEFTMHVEECIEAKPAAQMTAEELTWLTSAFDLLQRGFALLEYKPIYDSWGTADGPAQPAHAGPRPPMGL